MLKNRASSTSTSGASSTSVGSRSTTIYPRVATLFIKIKAGEKISEKMQRAEAGLSRCYEKIIQQIIQRP